MSQDRSWLTEAAALWPVLLVALGLAIVIAAAWTWWASRRSGEPEAAASTDALRRMADQVAEDLDAKADRLAMLIKHADRRIRELSEMTEGLASEKAGEGADPPIVTRTGWGREAVGARAPMNDPTAEQVYQMADSGLTAVQIAQKLSQPTGNVELMLALRR